MTETVKSFRADVETFDKFKAIATEEFSNQGQCLLALINLYETEKSKATIVERKLEIEDFQSHMNRIGELFLMSLQLNQEAELRIRSEFEKLLESKDRTIIDLQNKNSDLSLSNQKLELSSKDMKIENADFITRIVELENTTQKQELDFAAALSDKDKLNKALTDSCNERKTENEQLKIAVSEADEKLKSLNDVINENKGLEVLVQKLTSDLERQKELSELDKEKALLSADKNYQKELSEIRTQQHQEIKGYVSKVEKLQDQIELLRNENLKLTKAESKPKSKIPLQKQKPDK